jgi:hypothetical protein
MSEIIVICLVILAASNILWWAIAWIWVSRPEPRPLVPKQRLAFDVTKLGNWTCKNGDCRVFGIVMFFCGECPTCPECGRALLPVQASYWVLEKRVEALEAK